MPLDQFNWSKVLDDRIFGWQGSDLTWDSALVGLVAGVGPDVLLQVGQLGELPLADLAPVRLDAQVDSRVLRQVGAVGERLPTRRALVWLRFPQVDLGVELQVGLAVEGLGAHLALVLPHAAVEGEHVVGEPGVEGLGRDEVGGRGERGGGLGACRVVPAHATLHGHLGLVRSE